MKDQYVGDVNDYLKYAFLRRVLERTEARLVVCWMATPNDGTSDGRRRGYLDQPERYRGADPVLFDELRRLCEAQTLGIAAVQSRPILQGARFVPDALADSSHERRRYFDRLEKLLAPESIVFFDPDNGLAVKSTPKGRRGSSKYLYLEEFADTAEGGRSVIVYQHFGRVPRLPYIASQLGRLREAAPRHRFLVLVGAHVAFLVAAANTADLDVLTNSATSLEKRWEGLGLVRDNGGGLTDRPIR